MMMLVMLLVMEVRATLCRRERNNSVISVCVRCNIVLERKEQRCNVVLDSNLGHTTHGIEQGRKQQCYFTHVVRHCAGQISSGMSHTKKEIECYCVRMWRKILQDSMLHDTTRETI